MMNVRGNSLINKQTPHNKMKKNARHNSMERKIMAGVTDDNELYFLEIENKSEGHGYFAMSGFTAAPILVSEAEDRVREHLEDGDEWKYAVKDGRTELAKDEWVDFVIDTDGALAGFDNSLFPETVTVDDDEYIFESGSCGQHEEFRIKHYFIDKMVFQNLMRAWKQYHLKPVDMYEVSLPGNGTTVGYDLDSIPEQDFQGLAMQAVKLINSNLNK